MIDFYFYDELSSTQDYLLEKSSLLAKNNNLSMVAATRQTKGRGRSQRPWIDQRERSLLVSFGFCLPDDFSASANIAQFGALVTAEFFRKEGIDVRLKWPNDLLLERKKVGGVMAESRLVPPQTFIALGIGVNLCWDESELASIDQAATSLYSQTIQATSFYRPFGSFFVRELNLFFKEGFAPFLHRYSSLLIHKKGDPLSFHLGKERAHYFFDSLDQRGMIRLHDERDKISPFIAGETQLIPPSG